ncbi:serine hydrolase domain-containing protein [Muricoccus radiodurans]|uniref:serine hydrolase domain-containing protein n=1 Tax=Muricoccus radiodurans TaxID=2231721 RepID=UPI003CF59AB6
MRPSRRLLTGAALLAGAGAAVGAANLGVAAHRYGLEYLRRLALWGRSQSMRDPEHFPARAIAPSADPHRFVPAAGGPDRVRAAFAAVAGRHGAAGEALEGFLSRTRSTSLLVLADDRLAYEGYFNGAARGTPLTSMSMSKSVLALLAVAAVADGLVPGLDAPAEALLPEVSGLKGSGVTLRHLMSMTAGLRFEDPRPLRWLTWPMLFEGARVAAFTPDIRAYVATARSGDPPGSHFAYDDRSAQLVGLILERAAGRPVSDVLGERVWRPIGAEFPASWNLDHEDGFERMESGINAAALDWMKIGRLVLRDGDWQGRTLLPAPLLREAATPVPRPASARPYGLLWWGMPGAAAGATDTLAEGIFGQVLLVARTRGVVALRTGLDEAGAAWPALLRDLSAAL